jgi:putative salt-induced outer membrane protein YdiY
MRELARWMCACLLGSSAIFCSHADEVILVNGDRLTGTVVRKEGDELVLKTSYAGEVKIAWSHVHRVSADKPMALVLSDQRVAVATQIGPRPAAAAETPERSDQEIPPTPPDQVAYINAGPGIDLPGVRWKGRISVGARSTRGNTQTEDLHIDGEAVARRQHDRYTLSGAFDRGKDRDVLTKHNGRLSGKYDHFIRPTWYGYALLAYEEDRFRDIDRRTNVGAGIGHQVFETERTHLSLEAGLNYVQTRFGLAPDESYPAARWALKYEQRLLGTDLQLFHNHELLADLQANERTFIRTQTGLRLPLLERLLATVQLNADYDNAPAPGKTGYDRTYLFTLGYRW